MHRAHTPCPGRGNFLPATPPPPAKGARPGPRSRPDHAPPPPPPARQIWEALHRPGRDWYLLRYNSWPELAPGPAGFLVQVSNGGGLPESFTYGTPDHIHLHMHVCASWRRTVVRQCLLSHMRWTHAQPPLTLPPAPPAPLPQFVRFVILMAQAVPISLYVTLETVKVAQCKVRGAQPGL